MLRRSRPRGGFTLVEAAIVTAIVGIGCVTMLALLAAGTVSNATGTELTTAINLAQSIREMSLGLSFADPTTPTHWGVESGETSVALYDDLDDLDGRTFSPPIDARRLPLANSDTWAQRVTVKSVDPNRLTLDVPNGSTPTSRVTVIVSHRGHDVYQTSWLAVEPD